MRERSDEKLMKAYAGGEMAAFEILYERYREPLYRFILRQVGNGPLANDLYQGSWEKVIRGSRRYRPDVPFRAWLFRIARNHVVDHYRRKRPEQELKPDARPSAEPGPADRLGETTRRQRLGEAISELPDEQKDTLLLKLEAGLDLNTIARVTGVNPETAKSRLRYAVNRLRRELDD